MRLTRRGRIVGYVLLFAALVGLWSVLWWAAITGQEWKADRLEREGGTIPPISLTR